MTLGVASRVASSASAGWARKGFSPRLSSVACSGTSLTCSYSSCILMRSSISVAEGSSGRFISWLPTNMSWVRFNERLTAMVTDTRSSGPNTSSAPSPPTAAASQAPCLAGP
eukprot:CAMPEP_0115282760 /NCGR_PEP_ID=MMETSP0270-20121206/60015_1 /TAXON_ID=71861 /ORGANISM="Scrippsiella trochoidea, Strain CCMP3099" /LENGTH=111 /DNA_ID=CAMNT_0002699629 /DNA_START=20 /DNA_END=351 /DNA_ORIENTATION=+